MGKLQNQSVWTCTQCGTENFGAQPRCLRCGAPPQRSFYPPPPSSSQPASYTSYPPPAYPQPPPLQPPSRRPNWLLPSLALAALGMLVICSTAGSLYLFRQPLLARLTERAPQAAAPLPLHTQPLPEEPISQATDPAALPNAPAIASVPTDEPLPPTPTNTPDFPTVSFQGITFRYHPGLASGVFPLQVEAANEPGYVMPMFYEFDFGGYPTAAGMFYPLISVIPVQEYRSLDPDADEQISQLQTLLEQGMIYSSEPLPLLPVMMAAQLIRARVEVVQFKNGSGVRYLTQLAQDAWPINNEDLFLTYQGLTSDGSYYISAMFPVSHPDLPATGADFPTGDYLQFSENFAEYVATITQDLNQADPSNFIPDLNHLDDMIRSLQISP